METIVVIVALAVSFAFAIWCKEIARNKNRYEGAWFLLGFLGGVIALLAIFLAEPLPARVTTPPDRPPSPPGGRA